MTPLFPKADAAFERFFTSLGYEVTWEGRIETGERWYEIGDEDGLICQVLQGVPLAEFLTDLPLIVAGRPTCGPTRYWVACEDMNKLLELNKRAEQAQGVS